MFSNQAVKLETLKPGDRCIMDYDFYDKKKQFTVSQIRPDIKKVLSSGVPAGTFLVLLRDEQGVEFFANNTQQVYKVLDPVKLGDVPVSKKVRWSVGGPFYTKIEYMSQCFEEDVRLKQIPLLTEGGKLCFASKDSNVVIID